MPGVIWCIHCRREPQGNPCRSYVGVPVSGKGRPEDQWVGDGTLPMEEQRGMEMQKKAGAGPWRRLALQQGDGLAVKRLPVVEPQGFHPQEEHQPLRIFPEDRKEAIEQLVGDAGFFFRAQGRTVGMRAHGKEGEDRINGIGKKGDHVHGQDGMGFPAGRAFQAQDLHPHFFQRTMFGIP